MAHTNDSSTFEKRSGTTDLGKIWEDYTIANYILTIIDNPNVPDFDVWSNDGAFGSFDDVILNIGNKSKYALQLKHFEKTKPLAMDKLSAAKGDFSLQKYFTSFKESPVLNDYNLALLTNLKFEASTSEQIDKMKKIQMDIDGQRYELKIVKVEVDGLVDTSSTFCYKFKTTEEKSPPQQLEAFLEKLHFYPNQLNTTKLKKSITEKMKKLFPNHNKTIHEVVDKFLGFIENWSLINKTKEKLSKSFMREILSLIILTPIIRSITFRPNQEEMTVFLEAIQSFQITILNPQSIEHMEKIYGAALETLPDLEVGDKMLRKYQIPSEDDDVRAETYLKLLWILDKCPLIVSNNLQVLEGIKLCQHKKFILVGSTPDEEFLRNYSVFVKLADLEVKNKVVFDKLLQTIHCPVRQDKMSLAMKQEFNEKTTPNELLQMLDGSNRLKLDEDDFNTIYIPRSVSTKIIDFKFLSTFDDDTLIVISNITNNEIQGVLKKRNLKYVEDFLSTQSVQHSTSCNIIVTKNTCSLGEFQEICKRSKGIRNCHLFKICDGKLAWVKTKGDILQLQPYVIAEKIMKEDKLCSSKLLNNVILITGDPGTGKSWLLKKLKQLYFTQENPYFSILLSSEDIYTIYKSFLKKRKSHEYFYDYIIEHKYSDRSSFEKMIIKCFIETGQVVCMWDALDEVASDKHIDSIINLILKLSEDNSIHMVTARNHLKSTLEKQLKVLAISIMEFTLEEQKKYIYERLEKVPGNSDKIADFTETITQNIFMQHQNILSIPLQIYMLTELCLQDSEKFSSIVKSCFSVAEIYKIFVKKKLSLCFTEKIKKQSKKQIEFYEKIAIFLLFGSRLAAKLNINMSEWFKDPIDNFGFLTVEKKKNEVHFVHYSYLEYFAARYVVNHKNQPLIANLFQDKYRNVRFFVDTIAARQSPAHIAALNFNLEELKKHENDLRTEKDLLGRNVLQVLSSSGLSTPKFKFQKNGHIRFMINNWWDFGMPVQSREFLETLEYVSQICNPLEQNDILNMNSFKYAEKANCLVVPAVIEFNCKTGYYSRKDNDIKDSVAIYLTLLGLHRYINHFDDLRYIRTSMNQSLLHLAVAVGNLQLIRVLLSKGVDPSGVDEEGCEPLHWASLMPNAVENHVTIKIPSILGKSTTENVLHFALLKALNHSKPVNRDDIVTLLIEHKADVNAVDKNGSTSLHLASYYGHDSLVGLLTKRGASVNILDQNGSTPLHHASACGHDSLVDLLIAQGSDVNAVTQDDLTPLHQASACGHDSVVNLLITKGGNVSAVTKNGFTPLHLASGSGHASVVNLLIAKKGNVNAVNEDYLTPLHLASAGGHDSVVNLLIAQGGNVNAVDKHGFTPLDYASQNECVSVVNLLNAHVSKNS